MDPLQVEIQHYINQRDALQEQLQEIEVRFSNYIRQLRLFEADFMIAIDPLQQTLARWERRCSILEGVIAKLERLTIQPDNIPVALAPWIKEIEQVVLPPESDEMEIQPVVTLTKDEEKEAKELYRGLARRFHPDLVHQADLQAKRRVYMTEINLAYQSNDLQTLRELEHLPDIRPPEGETAGETWERLVREISRLKRSLDQKTQELEEAERSELGRMMQELGTEGGSRRFLSIQHVFAQRADYYRDHWQQLRRKEAELWLSVDR
ncbi:MAG: hypothetical protein VX278_20175 [Myxococcota bacterium]|nr:hypothetical protein [Myxococcota bacterium]